MTDQAAIDGFLAEKKLAVVGVSHDRNKFGNIVYRRLKAHGIEVFAVNPKINVIEGTLLSESVRPSRACRRRGDCGPPEATKQVVIDAAASGIKRVWMQPGAESDEAVRFCEDHGIEVIQGLCIMTLSGS